MNCTHSILTEQIELNEKITHDNNNSEIIVYRDEGIIYKGKDGLAEEYKIDSFIGEGVFGKVYEAQDVNNNEKPVAIKFIRNLPAYSRQGRKEIVVMKKLMENEESRNSNIVQMIDYFNYKGHVSIVFEKLDVSLLELIERTGYTGFPFQEISQITSQIINGLIYAKSKNIIHADIKPENILFVRKNSMEIRIVDWGSAFFSDEQPQTYLQSRFYRAPEVLFCHEDSPFSEIDTWSLGCIISEIYLGLPIFPGNSHYDQALKILNLLGFEIFLNKEPS